MYNPPPFTSDFFLEKKARRQAKLDALFEIAIVLLALSAILFICSIPLWFPHG